MNKKTLLVVATGILLAVAGAGVGATFSRYTSEATATPEAKVAKWAVKVGETDISNGSNKTFNAKITWETNENVETGYFAPGSKGHITFDIDATGTQVPVDYSIAIDETALKNHSQIAIKNVTASPSTNGVESTLEELNKDENENAIYTGSIELNAEKKKITITINLEWADNVNTNADDTILGAGNESGNTVLSLPVTVTASQRVAQS